MLLSLVDERVYNAAGLEVTPGSATSWPREPDLVEIALTPRQIAGKLSEWRAGAPLQGGAGLVCYGEYAACGRGVCDFASAVLVQNSHAISVAARIASIEENMMIMLACSLPMASR